MMHMMVIGLLLAFGSSTALRAEKVLVDEVVAVIYHPEESVIIARSDIRPGLDGAPRDLRQIINEVLMVLDAKKLKISITEEDVDRYLMQLQKQSGLTKLALENLFSQLGYTYEEGRELLKKKQMIDMIIDYRVRSNKGMSITPEAVRAYYEQNPLFIPMSFILQQAFIPYQDYSLEEVKQMIENESIEKVVMWEEPFTIEEDDLVEEKQFIKKAKIGSIVELDQQDDGIEITKLLKRTESCLIPFEDRSAQIELELKKERFYTLLHDYENSLLAQANIVFMNEADKKSVMNPISESHQA